MTGLPEYRPVWATLEIQVWICPDCGSCERYDDPALGAYTPLCEWCADDPEGSGEVAMIRHVAVPLAAWDAAPADATEAVVAWFNDAFAMDDEPMHDIDDIAADVLRALGHPETGDGDAD